MYIFHLPLNLNKQCSNLYEIFTNVELLGGVNILQYFLHLRHNSADMIYFAYG